MARRPLSDAAIRSMHLVALDSTNLVRRLEERHLEMVSVFSRLRDREGLVGAMRNYGLSARFEDVSVLPPAVQTAVTQFYEVVDELRWYFQFTTDMPGTLAERFAGHRKRLEEAHAVLSVALETATDSASTSESRPTRTRAKAGARVPARTGN